MTEIKIILLRARDEPKDPRDRKFQDELSKFSASLSSAGAKLSQRGMAFDSTEFSGYPLPEFTVSLANSILPVLGVALGAWLKGRYGRKARVKIGDVEAEAQTVQEIDALLQKIKQFQDAESPDNRETWRTTMPERRIRNGSDTATGSNASNRVLLLGEGSSLGPSTDRKLIDHFSPATWLRSPSPLASRPGPFPRGSTART